MKTLTFTFDNGPVPGATEKVLDFLAERGIKATFFVVGQRLDDARGRALVERAHAEGHWIGNHTLTHGAPLGIDGGADHVRREIGETQRRIEGVSHPRKFFRPNGAGSIGPHLLSRPALSYLAENGFTVVTWNNVPGDWLEPRRRWLTNALSTLENLDWSVCVLHDAFIADMMDQLERFHDELVRRDVNIVQEFPAPCIILDRGKPTCPLERYVMDGASDIAALSSN